MKKLKDTEMIDLMDELDLKGETSSLRETTLHETDAAALEDMKLAMMVLQAWEEAEPVQVSENFWPKLREQLPERPARSPFRSALSTLAAWVWPSHSPLAASMRVAVIAVILALASFWFAPQNATAPVVADFTPEQKVFIERSLQKHDNYVATQPDSGGASIVAGDAANSTRTDEEPPGQYVP